MKKILTKYDLPHKIIIDSGTQFESREFTKYFVQTKASSKMFFLVTHPQVNDVVATANKTIKVFLKKRLSCIKGNWIDELPFILWACWTSPKQQLGIPPF